MVNPRRSSRAEKPSRSAAAPGFHIPGFWDKVLDIDTCHLQPEPSNAIRNFIRDWAIQRNLPFFNPRSQEGWLRTMMIRVASTGDVLVVIQFRTELQAEREALLNDLVEVFPEIHFPAIRHQPEGQRYHV
jgi:23S rRNA (uracil1939-C5)-methyltransferase